MHANKSAANPPYGTLTPFAEPQWYRVREQQRIFTLDLDADLLLHSRDDSRYRVYLRPTTTSPMSASVLYVKIVDSPAATGKWGWKRKQGTAR
jgi:hypothetical protein